MGPKKKQAPKNAFYYFMLDYKESAEAKGRSFPGGLRDVANEASDDWEAMSKRQKKPYEDKARALKAELRGDATTKYTSTGVSYAEIDIKQQEEEQQRQFMIKSIENDIAHLQTKEALANKFFYLIHVNFYCMTDTQTYLPAEIAICEFSIKTGVRRVYHTFVNPGPPPTGYRLTALEHTEATHQIPIEYEFGDSRFSKILRDIKNFIKIPGSDESSPLYTMSDSVNHNTSISAVKSTLDMLLENEMDLNGASNMPGFNVFLLDRLFFEFRNACAVHCTNCDNPPFFPTLGIPVIELEKEIFSSTYDLACQFHQDNDRGLYCSLSKIKGWAYLLCDFCCQDVGVEMIPGLHCPELISKRYLNRKNDPEPPSLYDWQRPSSPRRPKTKQTGEGDGSRSQKTDIDGGNGWIVHSSEKTQPGPSTRPPSSTPSQPGSMSAVLQGVAPPDFSEQNFPAIGRGARISSAKRGGNSQGRLSSGMRGMRLN